MIFKGLFQNKPFYDSKMQKQATPKQLLCNDCMSAVSLAARVVRLKAAHSHPVQSMWPRSAAVTSLWSWMLNPISKSSLSTQGANRHRKQISGNLLSAILILEGSLHLWHWLIQWQVWLLVLLFVRWARGHHKLINTVLITYMSRRFQPLKHICLWIPLINPS